MRLVGQTRCSFLAVSVGLANGYRWAVLLAVAWGLVSVISWASVELNEEGDEETVEEQQESTGLSDEESPQSDSEEAVPDDEGEEVDFDLDDLLNESKESDLLQILEQDPDSEEYSNTLRCINASRMRTHEVLSDRFVIIHMSGDKKYLIQFEDRCMGLNPTSMVTFTRRSMRLCKDDELRVQISSAGGTGVWSGPCRIPGFEPVTEAQIDLLKQGLESERVE